MNKMLTGFCSNCGFIPSQCNCGCNDNLSKIALVYVLKYKNSYISEYNGINYYSNISNCKTFANLDELQLFVNDNYHNLKTRLNQLEIIPKLTLCK